MFARKSEPTSWIELQLVPREAQRALQRGLCSAHLQVLQVERKIENVNIVDMLGGRMVDLQAPAPVKSEHGWTAKVHGQRLRQERRPTQPQNPRLVATKSVEQPAGYFSGH